MLRTLDDHGINRGLACAGRGAWFDDAAGNDETFALQSMQERLLATATVDLRDALGAEQEVERMAERGVRVLRLFGALQGVPVSAPAYRHVARLAEAHRLTVLSDGDPREVWRPFADRGLTVVFLDVHAYHVADFVLLAREESRFLGSTRLLNSPDSIERVVAEVGAGHLAFGSRTPLHATASSELRFRHARITVEERAFIGGGWYRTLAEEGER
ncbi:hypothetical protein [Microbacterium sp. W4I4]|uniref:hypothetical protein n=1 Tax=Microbacterium sp. W4I4 TaxID=3042295 RepID=UPI0027D8CCFD|nr:hypothetical protein [Microbacterium sp. W4I4]